MNLYNLDFDVLWDYCLEQDIIMPCLLNPITVFRPKYMDHVSSVESSEFVICQRIHVSSVSGTGDLGPRLIRSASGHSGIARSRDLAFSIVSMNPCIYYSHVTRSY